MKKQVFLLVIFWMLGIAIWSCNKKEFVQINEDVRFGLTLTPSSDLVLSEATAADTVLTLAWDKPDFGFEAAVRYDILIDTAGGDFSNARVINAGAETTYAFTGEALNGELLALGMQPEVAGEVVFKVYARLSDTYGAYSEPASIMITPYSSYLDLSTEWGVVGSATPGGWNGDPIPDLPFYRTDQNNVLVAYVRLKDGEIKFRKNNDWTENYGDDGGDGTLDPNGANIPVVAGRYKITLDFNQMTYSIEPYAWGVVGSATPGGWNGPDLVMYYNPYENNFRAAVTLTDGEIKFRLNNDWTVNYGDDGGDGTLEANGANIPVAAGHYVITFDPWNLTYSIEATDLWGLVGSATPNGWNGPDIKFLPGVGPEQGLWKLDGVDLTAGEVKIRKNDSWAENYGDNGNDGTLEPDGANIPVDAGTYNITVDFNQNPPTIEILRWQS